MDQRLQGTGAPKFPKWLTIDTESKDYLISCERAYKYAANPQACLAGCVVWAMEVTRWHYGENIMVWTRPESLLIDLESIADAIGGV